MGGVRRGRNAPWHPRPQERRLRTSRRAAHSPTGLRGRAPFPSGLRLARALDGVSRGRPQVRKVAKTLFLAGFDGKR